MKKIFLYLSLCMILISCGIVAKKLYGIKKPKNEDKNSIIKFLKKNNIEIKNVCIFNSLKSMQTYSNTNKLSVPGALFFNKNGELIEYNKSLKECTKNITAFINDLKHFENRNIKEGINQSYLISLTTPISSIESLESADINVYIFWTLYLGRLNKESTFEWIRLIKEAQISGVKVNYYLVNCDLQKNWESDLKSRKVKIN